MGCCHSTKQHSIPSNQQPSTQSNQKLVTAKIEMLPPPPPEQES